MRVCSYPGCTRRMRTRGWCTTHYERWRRNGTLEISWNRDLMERISEKVEIDENGCWLWQGSVVNGYGKMSIGNRPSWVHRVAYEYANGVRLTSRIDIHHVCGVKRCCNPDHLEALTRREHAIRHRQEAAA